MEWKAKIYIVLGKLGWSKKEIDTTDLRLIYAILREMKNA